MENLEQANPVLNIAFYRFVNLTNLVGLRVFFRETCKRLGLKGTVLLSSEGINGFMAGLEPEIREFQRIIAEHPWGASIDFKESYSDRIPFQRLLIKLKTEIIPLGIPEIRPSEFTGARISPRELKRWLDENRDFDLLDTRNDYEIEYGTFKKAIRLGLRHFRDFPKKLNSLPPPDETRPLVMFCTGGIRCEKASVVAHQRGYRDVYQLDGGILNYFEECGDSHFEGECFVFDERVTLDRNLKEGLKQRKA